MSKYKSWASFEREITRALMRLGFDAKRNWSSQFIEKDGCDILATDGESELVLQLKYGKVPNIKKAYKEAESATTNKKQVALGVARWKGTKDTLVVMKWKDFERLVRGE